MKYNNQYYKIIAKLLDESIDNKHHTDLYYSKKIAESYGETYTDLGNVNKYLRDFAKDVGVELDNKHHTRLWYLKRIADALYDGELEHNTENYYLKIISENIDDPTPPTPQIASVSLTSDKSILSYYDNESATLSATVLDEDNQPIKNKTVEFYKGTSSLGTAQTNDNGVAIKTYNSQGVGDISLTASADSITSETYDIEDCIYYNTVEKTHSSKNSSTIYDSDMSVALPTNCEISYDLWSNNTNDFSEFRYFVLPKAQTSTGTTQPSYALFCDSLNNKVRFGKRDNSSSYNISNTISATNSNYHRIKYIRTDTSVGMYVNDNLEHTETINWLDNYSDYCMQMMRWNQSGTSKIKNVKIKPLT